MMRPLRPARAASASARMLREHVLVQGEGCLPQVMQLARLAQAGDRIEDLGDVLSDGLVGRHQAESVYERLVRGW